MRDYHDFEGLGDLPAENIMQSLMGVRIMSNYAKNHRKYCPMVRQVVDLADNNSFQPDVLFYRKDKDKPVGVAVVVIEIEDHKDFKKCLLRCQEHLAMNPELLEAFAYNMDKKYWVRYEQGNPILYYYTSYSEVLKLYLKDLK